MDKYAIARYRMRKLARFARMKLAEISPWLVGGGVGTPVPFKSVYTPPPPFPWAKPEFDTFGNPTREQLDRAKRNADRGYKRYEISREARKARYEREDEKEEKRLTDLKRRVLDANPNFSYLAKNVVKGIFDANTVSTGHRLHSTVTDLNTPTNRHKLINNYLDICKQKGEPIHLSNDERNIISRMVGNTGLLDDIPDKELRDLDSVKGLSKRDLNHKKENLLNTIADVSKYYGKFYPDTPEGRNALLNQFMYRGIRDENGRHTSIPWNPDPDLKRDLLSKIYSPQLIPVD